MASCVALLVAWAVGLEHPQWSAMTVWSAAQPTRGQLLEKSAFRVAGTVVGTIAGIALLLASGGGAWPLSAGLAGWIAACAWAGNLQRGYLSYGTMLAGFSAAMVALLETAHPERVYLLGLDRLLTVLVGVFAGLAVAWLLTPAASESEMTMRMRRASARVLRHLARRLSEGRDAVRSERRQVLSELAALDDAIDPHGAGSIRSRRSARGFRHLLIAQTRIVALPYAAVRAADRVAANLDEAAEALDAAAPVETALEAVGRAAAGAGDSRTAEALRGLAASLPALADRGDDVADRLPASARVTLHRDRAGARHAAIRAGAVMLLAGAFWAITGAAAGPYMMLGTAVMISVFSTFDDPAWIMVRVMLGQALGAVAALAC